MRVVSLPSRMALIFGLLGVLSTPTNTIWREVGSLCETTSRGDSIVHYETLGDRWFFNQFTLCLPGKCITTFKVSDVTGSHHRYYFQFNSSTDNVVVNEPAPAESP